MKCIGLCTEGVELQAFINFAPYVKINVNASVNSYFGGYELKGDTLKLGNVGMTRMMGPSMDIEDAVVKALGESVTIKVNKKSASVLDKNGKVVMELKKK